MKTALYYFTGTGNSLQAARDLSKMLGNTELISIVQQVKKKNFVISEERVGFVFPLYYLSFPKIVLDFLHKATFSGTKSVFAVITRGLNPMGAVIPHLRKILKPKNVPLDQAYYLDMPNNDIVLFDIQSKAKQEKVLMKAKEQLKEIGQKLLLEKRSFSPEPFRFMKPFRYNLYLKKIQSSHKNFITDANCNGCGICSKVCAMDCISMVDKKPVWEKGCQECEGCINICPKRAIQYESRTQKKGRYKHPDVTIQDLINQK